MTLIKLESIPEGQRSRMVIADSKDHGCAPYSSSAMIVGSSELVHLVRPRSH